jgi:hypothetical protein
MSKMGMMLVAGSLALACRAGAGTAPAGRGAPKVVSGPAVSKTGTAYSMSFKVNRPCDVTVRVLDSKGDVVRHLACGMVGLAKAADPLKANSLSQTIAWDGKDDPGRPVPPEGCRFTVSVGLAARFDRFILWEPDGYDTWRKDGLEILKGASDEYLVTQHCGVHLTTTRVFDGKGKFVRQIWPCSVSKPKEMLKRLLSDPRVGAEDWDGRRVPVCVNHNATYHFGTAFPALVGPDGRVLGIHRYCSDYLGVWTVGSDGLPALWGWYPPWQPRKENTFNKTLWKFAAGTDGDVYLADGLHHVVGHFRLADMSPIESFRFSGKEALKKPRCYIGKANLNYQLTWQRGPNWKEEPVLDDESHFAGPAGVAVDEDGYLLVLDGTLNKSGTIAGEAKVKVYTRQGRYVRTDDAAHFPASAPPVPGPVVAAGENPRALCFPHFLRVDSKGRLYVRNHGAGKPFVLSDINGKTFETFNISSGRSPSHGYTCVGPGDNWYVAACRRGEPARVLKFSPDGEPLDFGGRDAITIEDGLQIKGVYVTRSGDVYVVVATDKWKVTKDVIKVCAFGDLTGRGEKVWQTRVDLYGSDGTLKTQGVVKSVGINDVAVDRDGNIYVIDGTMWHGAQMASTAKGRVTGGKKAWPFGYLTPEQAALDPKTQWNKRFNLLSRLVKFGPQGGALDGADGEPQLWDHAGVSGVSPWNCGDECPGAQIVLDPDERLWVPDTFLYNVKAVDKAGNLIIRVGAYGNEDCRGGGGDEMVPSVNVVKNPEVPLARPSGMAVYRNYLFISDMFTHRVVRCRLTYADTRETPIR